MMPTIAVVDYGMCNLDSVERALQECGAKPVVSDRRADIEQSDALVLPGVGAFRDGMENLRERGLEEVLRLQVMERRKPILGICLGMQLMARRGFEFGETPGLSWLDAEVRKFVPTAADARVPHVGWNEVNHMGRSPLFADVPSGRDFYFVHSYHVVCRDNADVVAKTPYCGSFVSAVQRENILGVQFHPEKSQHMGLKLIENFVKLAGVP